MAPSEPLGVISDSDQSGLILILTALALSFVLVSFAIRLYIRVPQRLWKNDDNVLTAATFFSIIQTSLVFYEVHLGYGKQDVFRGDSPNSEPVKKYHFANDFLYLVVLLFSKLTVCFLFLRLTRRKEHILGIYSIIGCCGGWFLLSILLISIGSSWQNAYSIPFGRWLGVGITDSITEIVFVVFAGYLVGDLRMTKVQKGTVVFAFGLRLLAIPACVIRLYYLHRSTLPDNRSIASSLAVVCAQIQLGYGIMAASVTVLKPFMVVYEKPLGYSGYSNSNHPAKQYGTNNSDHVSFKMKPVVRSTEVVPDGLASHAPGIDPNQPTYSSRSPAPPREKMGSGGERGRSDSIHSHDSRRLIIERKTAWSIRYEEAESHKSNASETGGSV
ncbi:hypothetical protein H2200_011745 [Cladophialophora chaetospira]|uniref:Rhodopsin domain-containing protein n=1 Tax=Cladophialophora chaetospira TaxID=386627 RepID=A0AA39CCT3_9EURO|nr:hypothetical protein H2200_011745 [Cladophialophora chaetospira]